MTARKWRASLLESPDSENPLTSIDFGVVTEGTEKSLSLWLRNLEDVEVHGIEIQMENDTVMIEGVEVHLENAVVVVVPESLGPMEAKEVEFTWRVDESSVALRQAFPLLAKVMEDRIEVVYEKVSKLRGVNRDAMQRILEVLREERFRLN